MSRRLRTTSGLGEVRIIAFGHARMIFFAKINLHQFHHNLFRTASQMTKAEQRFAADCSSVQPAFSQTALLAVRCFLLFYAIPDIAPDIEAMK